MIKFLVKILKVIWLLVAIGFGLLLLLAPLCGYLGSLQK